VPVAEAVATALGAPLDILVVRKVGCPWRPELGIGALAEGGCRVLNRELIAELGIDEADLAAVSSREAAELERRVGEYRRGREPLPVEGRLVILVDDGLATGFTALAAVESLRRRAATKVILAVPVAPPATVAALRENVEVVALETPSWFGAVGEFYEDFSQTSDAEVVAALERRRSPARRERGERARTRQSRSTARASSPPSGVRRTS
jgi:predicted phosphoribosyltransferase